MKICHICKINIGTVIGTVHRYKNTVYTYYRCTPCNNKIVKKYYHSKGGSKKVKSLLKIYYAKNKHKTRARKNLNTFIKRKNIKKPTICSICKLQTDRIQAHHNDYSKPLDVIWVCGKCHWKIDRK